MRKIEPIVQTVVVKSVAEQVEELPTESVILVKRSRLTATDGAQIVLHRTGRDGWLPTRSLSSAGPAKGGHYYKTAEVVEFIERVVAAGRSVLLIHEGDA